MTFIILLIASVLCSGCAKTVFYRFHANNDRCTLICENGGTVTSNCECECGYGFTGERCEKLQKQHLFSDPSCGIVNISEVALSEYPKPSKGGIFCQWLVKGMPSEYVEFSIQDLDLDSEKMNANLPCNDMFYIWGSKQISNPIPCDPTSVDAMIGKVWRSDSNWLLIELRMNPWSEVAHKGPLIKYRLVNPSPNQGTVLQTFSSEISVSKGCRTFVAYSTLLFTLLCFLCHRFV